MNPYQERNRQRKASALLVQALREDLAAADVALFSDEEWAALADRSSVKVPSETTREIVVTSLERREAPLSTSDVYAMLAGDTA